MLPTHAGSQLDTDSSLLVQAVRMAFQGSCRRGRTAQDPAMRRAIWASASST